MFLWNNRAAYFAQQQREIDAIPAPAGRADPRITPFWHTKRVKRAPRRDNSKPKRKDHRYGLAHA